MSPAPATPPPPETGPDTPPIIEQSPSEAPCLVEDLISLSRTASRGLTGSEPPATDTAAADRDADHWYRLGLRNAYAQAAGLLLAPELGEDPHAIADRVTAGLDAGITDPTALRHAAYGRSTLPAVEQGLEWLGPTAFATRHGVIATTDRHFGARWGARGEQRITFRPDPVGGRGTLFAHDPTWDEYAVLATHVAPAAVEAAYAHATRTDIHLDPAEFARLVHTHTADQPTPAPRVTGVDLGMQL